MKIGFSIIMPNYNSLYIDRAIKSVINQKFSIWELIIIDNYSENFPDNLFRKYNDNRITCFKFKNSGIIAKSRNFGIRKAKYDWVAFLDSDDVWSSNKLLEVKEVLENNNTDLVYHAMYYLPKSFGIIKKKISDKSNKIIEPIFDTLIKEGNGIANSSVVIKKEKLVDINLISENEEKFSWEDFDCWLRLAFKKNKFYFIDKVLGYIWIGNGRVSNNSQFYTNSKNFMRVYRNSIKKILKNNNHRPKWILNVYANYFFRKNQHLRSFYFFKSLKANSIKSIIKYLISFLFLILKRNKFFNIKKFYLIIKKILNKVSIYQIVNIDHKTVKEFNMDQFEFKVIKKYEEIQNYQNYFTSLNLKSSYERFKKYKDELLVLIDKEKNNIACYGWSTKKSPHIIEEVNKKFFFENGNLIYDFKTLENYRNKKLYKCLLNKIIFNFNLPLYIYSLKSNQYSKKTIINSGFKKIKNLNILSNDFIQKNIK